MPLAFRCISLRLVRLQSIHELGCAIGLNFCCHFLSFINQYAKSSGIHGTVYPEPLLFVLFVVVYIPSWLSSISLRKDCSLVMPEKDDEFATHIMFPFESRSAIRLSASPESL